MVIPHCLLQYLLSSAPPSSLIMSTAVQQPSKVLPTFALIQPVHWTSIFCKLVWLPIRLTIMMSGALLWPIMSHVNGILPLVPVLSPTAHSLGSFAFVTLPFCFSWNKLHLLLFPTCWFCLSGKLFSPDRMSNYFRTFRSWLIYHLFKKAFLQMLSPSLAFITSVPLSFFFLFNAFFPV